MPRSLVTEKKNKNVKDVVQARELYIRKANDLVQKTRYQLSLQENKILLYIISKISENDKELNQYNLSLKEFCEVCELQSKGSYTQIKKIAKGMRDKSFWMEDEKGGEFTIGWLQRVYINNQKGTIELTLDESLKPYLLNMKKKFTKYKYLYVMAMKSSYSMRIYELLKSYQNIGGVIFTVEELKAKLGIEKGKLSRWFNFKAKALEVALEEINFLTDITVLYDVIKQGREVHEVRFRVFKKNQIQLKTAHERIHNKLGVFADLAECQKQNTIEEWDIKPDKYFLNGWDPESDDDPFDYLELRKKEEGIKNESDH